MKLLTIVEENETLIEVCRTMTRILENSLRDSIEDMHAGDGEFSEDDMKEFNLTIRDEIYTYVINAFLYHKNGFNKKEFFELILKVLESFIINNVDDKKRFKKLLSEGVKNAFDLIKRIRSGEIKRDVYLSRYLYDRFEPAKYIDNEKN